VIHIFDVPMIRFRSMLQVQSYTHSWTVSPRDSTYGCLHSTLPLISHSVTQDSGKEESSYTNLSKVGSPKPDMKERRHSQTASALFPNGRVDCVLTSCFQSVDSVHSRFLLTQHSGEDGSCQRRHRRRLQSIAGGPLFHKALALRSLRPRQLGPQKSTHDGSTRDETSEQHRTTRGDLDCSDTGSTPALQGRSAVVHGTEELGSSQRAVSHHGVAWDPWPAALAITLAESGVVERFAGFRAPKGEGQSPRERSSLFNSRGRTPAFHQACRPRCTPTITVQ
jgi:hypothetical protein